MKRFPWMRFCIGAFLLLGIAIILIESSRKPIAAAAPVRQTDSMLSKQIRDAKQASISIDNFKFAPRELSLPVGSTVTWVNHDDVPHTATSSDNPATFNSKTLDTDGTYSFTFTKPETYSYFCKVHPHMTGVIVIK